jgi:tRNA threonylcarbamoyladenosine biosynthesis protein TsaE
MSTTERLVSTSPEQTADFAAAFAASLVPGDWVGLTGPLGAGKTVWVRGVGRALGIQEHIVSPTYSLLNLYQGRLRVCHLDLYRVRSSGEIVDFGLDACDDGQTVVLVEWAGNLPELEFPFRWHIEFERTGDRERVIVIREDVLPQNDRMPS